jgi:hypothetical protein
MRKSYVSLPSKPIIVLEAFPMPDVSFLWLLEAFPAGNDNGPSPDGI